MTQHHLTAEEIREKVFSVISEVSGLELSQLDMSLSIREDIAPSSLDLVTLFMALEDEFSKTIAEDEFQNIVSLGDLIGFVEHTFKTSTA